MAAAWEAANGAASVFVNGRPAPIACNPAMSRRGDGPRRQANPSRAPFLVGACGEGGGSAERPRGAVTDVRYWPSTRTAAMVQAGLFARRLPPPRDVPGRGSSKPPSCGWAALTRKRSSSSSSSLGGGGLGESEGGGGLEALEAVAGRASWAEARRGDQVLSATLTVAEERAKGSGGGSGGACGALEGGRQGVESVRDMGAAAASWCALAPPSVDAAKSLASALRRHFFVLEDQEEVQGPGGRKSRAF